MDNFSILEKILYVIFGQIIFIDITILSLLFIGTLFLLTQKYYRLGRRFIIACAMIILIIVISPLPRWGMIYLENYYPKLENIPADLTGIIVLAGSQQLDVSSARHLTAYGFNGGRIIQALELIHQNPQLKVIFSGHGHVQEGAASEADMTRELVHNLGIDSTNIYYENKSKNTIENALMTASHFKTESYEKWLLVTSAYHMPRSIGLFRHQGFNVVPYPVDYHTTGQYDWRLNICVVKGLMMWRVMTNEILGMLRNWLFDHSQTIWPARG